MAERSSSRAKAIFLILLLLSSGLSFPTASAIQRYEFSHDFFQPNLAMTQPSGPNSGGGASFFSNVPVSSIAGVGYSSTSAQVETPGSLPLIPVTGSGADYFYARQGNVYNVFPERILENGGSPYALVAVGPLLSVWFDTEKRRSRFRIYVEILDLLRMGPMTPYEVSFHLRLNSKRTREYIELLLKRGFLEYSEQDGKAICAITEVGKSLAENIRAILEPES